MKKHAKHNWCLERQMSVFQIFSSFSFHPLLVFFNVYELTGPLRSNSWSRFSTWPKCNRYSVVILDRKVGSVYAYRIWNDSVGRPTLWKARMARRRCNPVARSAWIYFWDNLVSSKMKTAGVCTWVAVEGQTSGSSEGILWWYHKST